MSTYFMNSISHNLIIETSPKYITAMSGHVGLEWFLRAKIHKSIAAFFLLVPLTEYDTEVADL